MPTTPARLPLAWPPLVILVGGEKASQARAEGRAEILWKQLLEKLLTAQEAAAVAPTHQAGGAGVAPGDDDREEQHEGKDDGDKDEAHLEVGDLPRWF